MSEWINVTSPATSHPGEESVPVRSAAFSRSQPEAADTPIPAGVIAAAAQALSMGKALTTAVSVYAVFVVLIFYDTLSSMVSIWLRSQTFAHGFLILPISLWLVWRLRDRLNSLSIRSEPRALFLVLGAGLAWLLAQLVDVQVIQHLALVTILVSGIWAIAGTEITRSYAFPLGFLYLAVPMGAGLIAPLMVFTADTTEFLLRLSGIPVFREGMYLSLPSGTWSVIEECSGVRYLIASVTLGLCYAHLSYNSLWRQASFMAVAVIAPILANSVRAYGVVMTGHLSDMRFGVGADHLIYGWLFFGLVLLLMFWIGSFWQQSPPPLAGPGEATTLRHKVALSLSLGTGLALLCAGVWPALAFGMNRNIEPPTMLALTLPVTQENWQAVDKSNWHWRPGQTGADRELDQLYASVTPQAAFSVGLHIRQYLQQQQGAELVTNTDPWRPDRKAWRVIEQQQLSVKLGLDLKVDEAWVASVRDNLLVWSWYHIDGRNTANPYLVKLLEAKQQLLAGHRQGSRIFIATAVGEDPMQARQILQDFITDYRTAIEAALDNGINDQKITDMVSPPGVAE